MQKVHNLYHQISAIPAQSQTNCTAFELKTHKHYIFEKDRKDLKNRKDRKSQNGNKNRILIRLKHGLSQVGVTR